MSQLEPPPFIPEDVADEIAGVHLPEEASDAEVAEESAVTHRLNDPEIAEALEHFKPKS